MTTRQSILLTDDGTAVLAARPLVGAFAASRPASADAVKMFDTRQRRTLDLARSKRPRRRFSQSSTAIMTAQSTSVSWPVD